MPRLIAEARGFAPLLLLDEPAVHLDPARRAALFDALRALPAQVLADRHRPRHVPAAGRHGAEAFDDRRRCVARDPDFPRAGLAA